MNNTILITGATGNVGSETLRCLMQRPDRDYRVCVASRNPEKDRQRLPIQPDSFVRFDFEDDQTYAKALRSADRVLLIRPPQLADVDRYFKPLIRVMSNVGTKQVVFLSLQGVENNSLTPHHKIEKLIVDSGIPYTFLRPSFFMQNLSTTHRAEIAERNEIFVPAGDGRTSFVDVADIGEVAAMALTDPTHLNEAYELTGSEALTYSEVADILTDVLGRPIRYTNPSIPAFIWRKRYKENNPLGFTLIMVALYTVARLGKADGVSDTMQRLLGRMPRTFRAFAEANKSVWLR